MTGWKPRTWTERLSGCVWLPRLLDKGRRALETQRTGQDQMNGYLFGNNDYADKRMLKCLGTDDRRVLELLAASEDDAEVADRLVRESGKSPEEIEAWNEAFARANALFLAMMEADEGLRPPGFKTWLLEFSYNYLLMPGAYLAFSVSERFRSK